MRLILVMALVLTVLGCKGSPPSAPAAHDDAGPQAALVAFPAGPLTLHGYLYRPSGEGPFPAVVYNHGSERWPGNKRDEAMFYVPRGFVLFVPHRRGQGASSDAGEYIGDHASDHARVVGELVAQTGDVLAAIEYVGALPFVDRAHVAVAGCWFGGIVSLLAAERGEGIDAAVDFAGGAMSWARSPELQERMKQAGTRSQGSGVLRASRERLRHDTKPGPLRRDAPGGQASARARVSAERLDARGGPSSVSRRGAPRVGR
jgi:hypothetical protein